MILKRLAQAVTTKYSITTPVLLASLCLSSSLLAAAPPPDDVNAVYVGHSLINHDMPAMVKQLAASGENLSIEYANQMILGSPLVFNWNNCLAATATADNLPAQFACDAIAQGSTNGPYDTLIMTEANNPIRGHHTINETQVYIDRFFELMQSRHADSRAFFFTSWEGLSYHGGNWLDEIDGELAEYEQIVAQAKRLAIDAGRNPNIEIIPANIALRDLILALQSGQFSGFDSRLDVFHDDVHMNLYGNYFIANVVFATIYNRSPVGLTNRILNQYGNVQIEVEASLAEELQQFA